MANPNGQTPPHGVQLVNLDRSKRRRWAFWYGKNKPTILAFYADPNYTTNLCPNPSFETDLTGWSATDAGTSISQVNVLVSATGQMIGGLPLSLYGSQSLQVTTDGSSYNQGVIGPAGTVPLFSGGPVLGSMTASVFGETGTVNVSAIANPGGITLGTRTIVLSGNDWTTVTLNNLDFTVGTTVYVQITTAFSQDIQFNVDGIMYQPSTPAHPYIDGSSPNCSWTGTAHESTSFQQYQFPFNSLMSFQLSGTANFINLGEVFPMSESLPVLFTVTPSAGVNFGVASPVVALTDFGIWELTDPDPAQTYGWWTNSGTNSGSNSYTRSYAMVVPPIDYPVSNGQYAWRRAAYGLVGFQWKNVTSGITQLLTDVQLEYCKTQPQVATTPSTYQRPRQLQVIIKPNRLNYITNPAMQVSTSGWSGIHGDEVLSVDNTQFPGAVNNYNNLPQSIGQSLNCKLVSTSSQGVQISLTNLLPGFTYMASFWALPGLQTYDITASCGTGSGDFAALFISSFGQGQYGSGPYGGVENTTTTLPQVWAQCSFSFTAQSDVQTLTITPLIISGSAYPNYVNITAVMVEPGDILNPYFDGNSGADAIWEYTGGTTAPFAGGGASPGLSRSYYYNQLTFGQQIVLNTLNANTPLGISYATPLYGTPPLQ